MDRTGQGVYHDFIINALFFRLLEEIMAENSAPNEVSSESETPTRHEVDKQLVLTGADIVGDRKSVV